MKKLIIFSLISLISLGGFTQSVTLVRADEYFELLAYSKAAELYENLYEKNSKDEYLVQQLAYCYDKMGKVEKAIDFYALHVRGTLQKKEDLYQYAKLLQTDEQNELAIEWAGKYLELNPDDGRAQQLIEKIKQLEYLKTLHIVSEVKNELFNMEYSDMSPAYFKDGIVFASARDESGANYMWTNQPFLDFYYVTQYGDKVEIEPFSKRINSKYHEGSLVFNREYSKVWYTRNDEVKGKSDLVNLKMFTSEWNGSKWSKPEGFELNSDEYSVGHPALSPDEKYLYFVSDGLGSIGKTDIFKVELFEDSISEPMNIGSSVNTLGKEMFPFIDSEGVLYFASDAHGGFGGLDIFAAFPVADTFMVVNIGEPVNSTYDDFGLIMSTDKMSGYFTSNRPGGKGDDDIYSFNVMDKKLLVEVRSMTTKGVLKGVEITIHENDVKVNNGFSSDEGLFEQKIVDDSKYEIKADKDGYKSNSARLNEFEFHKLSEGKIIIYLESDYNVKGNIVNSETGEEIEGVNVKIDLNGIQFMDFTTDASGTFEFDLKEKGILNLNISKDGFLTHHVDFQIDNLNSDGFEFTEKLVPVYENKTFVLEGLYYDLNKWNIRPDAAIVLDEVYQIMIDNPTLTIELSSHTDSRGSDSYNQRLSQKRAESAVNYIVSKGIDASRIVAKGYGETRLVNRCSNGVKCSAEEHQSNRRTEIEVTSF